MRAGVNPKNLSPGRINTGGEQGGPELRSTVSQASPSAYHQRLPRKQLAGKQTTIILGARFAFPAAPLLLARDDLTVE